MFGNKLIFQRSIKRRSNELRIFEIKCVDYFVLDEYILIISLLDSIYALSVMNHGGADIFQVLHWIINSFLFQTHQCRIVTAPVSLL